MDQRDIQEENLPRWYSLGIWNDNLVVHAHCNALELLAKYMQRNEDKFSKYYLGTETGLTSYSPFSTSEAWGFGNCMIPLAPGSSEIASWQLAPTAPQSVKGVARQDSIGLSCSLSLILLLDALKTLRMVYPDEVPNDGIHYQLLSLKLGYGNHDHAFNFAGILSISLVSWLFDSFRQHAKCIKVAGQRTHDIIMGKASPLDAYGALMSHQGMVLSVMGNSTEVHTDEPNGLQPRMGAQFTTHNVEGAAQQLGLLAMLACICDQIGGGT